MGKSVFLITAHPHRRNALRCSLEQLQFRDLSYFTSSPTLVARGCWRKQRSATVID